MGQVYQLPYGTGWNTQAGIVSMGLQVGSQVLPRSSQGTNPYYMYIAADQPNVFVAGYSLGEHNFRYYVVCANNFGLGRTTDPQYSGSVYSTVNSDEASVGVPCSSTFVIANSSDTYAPITNATNFLDLFTTQQDAFSALQAALAGNPITYRLTNCTAPGAPDSAVSGESVSVPLSPAIGYEFINPASDIYVTNNGVAVESSFANGVLTFTMP